MHNRDFSSFSLRTILILTLQKKYNNKGSSELNFQQGRLGSKNKKILTIVKLLITLRKLKNFHVNEINTKIIISFYKCTGRSLLVSRTYNP